ncbi:FMN-linked oxidoreductase [Artomyces pyxidatus]|uniref:FMN-linked oxidoreductase n=1 Tax=Artomyces pyxidatus TaxID=48021 RepID=A0ACB8SHB0_9AGAM|nr:FMN-linked oxidoreductase [Artomyces pyxidatus]
MSPISTSKLFQPIVHGGVKLQHRVVMAPLTRMRSNERSEPTPLVKEYYEQRASAPGTLLISEGTCIAPQGAGLKGIAGIYTDGQVAAWKQVVDAVHAKGSFMYLQIAALGAVADSETLAAAGHPYVGAGDLPIEGRTVRPRPLTVDEIHEYEGLFATAARRAVEEAGFDGVELHMCHGSLLDQFLQTNQNNRTDEYGGSEANRVRFPLAAIDAVVAAIGAQKTGVRLSPWSRAQGMRMPDPIPTYVELVTRLRKTHPDLAHLHVVEPRILGLDTREPEPGEQNDFIRAIWAPGRYITAAGYTRESGIRAADETDELICYGRYFIANPDLVRRLKENAPLNQGNRATYYSGGAAGYTDYPFLSA